MVGNADRDERLETIRNELRDAGLLVGVAVCQQKFTKYIPNIYYISSVAAVVKVLFNKADAIFANV